MSVVLIWKTEMNLKQTTVLTSPQIKPEKQPYTIAIQRPLTRNVQTITFFFFTSYIFFRFLTVYFGDRRYSCSIMNISKFYPEVIESGGATRNLGNISIVRCIVLKI